MRLGQNFLEREEFLDRIIEAVKPEEGQVFVELGPGRGQLTSKLLEAGATVVGVEVDPVLARELERRFRIILGERFFLVRADFLRTEISELWESWPVRFVSNVPFYITHRLLEKLRREALGRFSDIHITLQLEVVRKLLAKPRSKDYCAATVLAQLAFDMEHLFTIPSWAFRPKPKVAAGFLRMLPKSTLPKDLENLIKRAFSARRRKLSNSLGVPEWVFKEAGVDPDLRADQLEPEGYLRIWEAMKSSL